MGLFGRLFANNKAKKDLSDVEIENSYFGNGILVKDSSSEPHCYRDIKSGFDGIDSFGKKSDITYDLHEFIVKEDNIDHEPERRVMPYGYEHAGSRTDFLCGQDADPAYDSHHGYHNL